MRLLARSLPLVLLVIGTPARAAVVEIPLPSLEGTSGETQRQALVTLPSKPSVIHSVSVRILGTATPSVFECQAGGPPVPVELYPSTSFYFDAPPGWWVAYSNPHSPTFDDTVPFQPGNNAAWDFLLDGSAALQMFVNLPFDVAHCQPTAVEGTETVTGVTLLVDAEFPTPTRNATWGRIKSIYR